MTYYFIVLHSPTYVGLNKPSLRLSDKQEEDGHTLPKNVQ